jgi:hypothetical protein
VGSRFETGRLHVDDGELRCSRHCGPESCAQQCHSGAPARAVGARSRLEGAYRRTHRRVRCPPGRPGVGRTITLSSHLMSISRTRSSKDGVREISGAAGRRRSLQ